jgi:hypothetical protein
LGSPDVMRKFSAKQGFPCCQAGKCGITPCALGVIRW